MHVATAVSHFGWKEIHRKNSVGTVPLMWAVLLTCDVYEAEDEYLEDPAKYRLVVEKLSPILLGPGRRRRPHGRP